MLQKTDIKALPEGDSMRDQYNAAVECCILVMKHETQIRSKPFPADDGDNGITTRLNK